jgi:hypothetical protein
LLSTTEYIVPDLRLSGGGCELFYRPVYNAVQSGESQRTFRGAYLQGIGISQERNREKRVAGPGLPPAYRGYFLDLVFDPEGEGEMFPRNVRLSPSYIMFSFLVLKLME